MKLAVGEWNVATNLGTILGCDKEYCFSIWITNVMNVFKDIDIAILYVCPLRSSILWKQLNILS